MKDMSTIIFLNTEEYKKLMNVILFPVMYSYQLTMLIKQIYKPAQLPVQIQSENKLLCGIGAA
jgi:hypothetical protein